MTTRHDAHSARRNLSHHAGGLLTLVHDPTGDFTPGSRWGTVDVVNMLRANAQAGAGEELTLANGTQFRTVAGRALTVRGGHVWDERGGKIVLVKGWRR